MKVLIINAMCTGASIGKIAYKFCQMLNQNGHEALLAYGMGEDIDDNNLVRFVPRIEPKIHFRYNLITGYHGTFGPIGLRNIKRIIKEFKPDVIQLYNLHGYYLNEFGLYRYLSKKKIPVVYGMLDEYPYLGYCCYAYDCEKFKTECNDCEYRFEDRYRKSLFFNRAKKTFLLKQRGYDSLDRIIFTGPEWVVERAKVSSLLKDRDVRLIDEYIDTDEIFYPKDADYLRKKHNLPMDKIVVLDVASSMDARKGIRYFVELASRFDRDDIDNYVFINVGYCGGYDNLPDNYITVPFVSNQDELADYYSLADVFVCTSMADTMPNSCLDAMSCGTQVIGFNITGMPYVAHEPIGTFVSPGSVDELQTAVRKVEKKSQENINMCREYALSRYSPKVYYEKQFEIYEELLAEND